MKTYLGHGWERHSRDANVPTDAYLTCHGSWEVGDGWTTSPSSMIFYTFHGDSMYTVEIQQVLEQPRRLRLDTDVFDVSPRSATSISRPNTLIWNYHFTSWDTADHMDAISMWRKGPLTGDLLTLRPSNESALSCIYDGRQTSNLKKLFKTLVCHNICYERVHFLVCRAVEGRNTRKEPKSTKELYQQKTPYW